MRSRLVRGFVLGGGACVLFLPRATAQLTDLYSVTVQPIIVYDDSGSNPAPGPPALDEQYVATVWNQAQISVTFLPANTFNSSNFQSIVNTTGPQGLLTLEGTSGNGQNASPYVINMWFVNSISYSSSVAAGLTQGNGIAIAIPSS